MISAGTRAASLVRKFMPDADLYISDKDAQRCANASWHSGWRYGFATGLAIGTICQVIVMWGRS